ncbi:hypothetical protein JCM9279_007125 [Rhodotorula babjevae]
MDAAQEHAIRAHTRSLAVHLVPPSSPILASLPTLLLPAPSRPLAPIPIDHDERNIDFWDARRVKEWEDERRRDELWEMTRTQVDELKRSRREWVEAVKYVKEEGEGVQGLPAPYAFPLRLGDDFVLSRARRRAWPDRSTSFDSRTTFTSLLGPPPAHLLPEPDEALLAMDTVPELDDAFDLKLSITADQFADVKRIRSAYTSRQHLDDYLREDEQAWVEALAHVPSSSVPRLGSPPIFPRSRLASRDYEGLLKDPFGGLLPSERSEYPSSPRGLGISQAQWNKEEGFSSLPASSPERVQTGPPPPIWSSSPGKIPPRQGLELEPPIFDRLSRLDLPAARPLDVSQLAQLLKDDDPETDQLEPSDLEDDPDVRPAPHATTSVPLFASDDTLGDLDEQVNGATSVRRSKPPKLSLPHNLLRTSTAPALSSFAAANAPSSSWTLAPLPGLRALTLDLSWRAWTLPADETLEDLLLGEDDVEGAAVEREREKKASSTVAAGDMDDVEHEQEGLSVTSTLGLLVSAEDDDDELLISRVPVEVEQPATEVVATLLGAGLADDSVDDMVISPVAFPADDVALDSAAHAEQLDPGQSPFLDNLSSTAPPDSAHVASARHRPSMKTSSLTAVPDSSSSDFGFIFPPASSPSSPPGQHADSRPIEVPLDRIDTVESSVEVEPTARSQSASRDEPVARLEKVEASGPAWSNAAALDRFLAVRGRAALSSFQRDAPTSRLATVTAVKPAPPSAHSSPPPGAIPFTLPPFLSAALLSASYEEPVRIVAFNSVLQMRPHLAALHRHAFLAIPRTSRFPSDAHRTLEPHILVDPRSAVLFLRLDALVSNVVRVGEPMVGPLARPEAVMTTVARLAARFDRVLVVLEESGQRIGGVKRYGFTPPVLAALQQLASGLAELGGGRHGVEAALSKGPEHSVTLVRRWVDYLCGEDEAASVEEGLPVLELWGERAWLSEDPSQDEASLLQLDDVNELSACAILGVCSASEFYALSTEDRRAVFARLLGDERVIRISTSISAIRPSLLASPSSSSGFLDAPTVSISQLGALEEEAVADEDLGQWAEWVDFDASPGS